MIERIYIQNHTLLGDVELFFRDGLIVFSGPSGSGKSVFFEALLCVFGIKNSPMDYAVVDFVTREEEVLSFEYKKVNSKARFYLNKQNISKASITSYAKQYISFLHVQDFSDFSSAHLIQVLDSYIIATQKTKKYAKRLDSLKEEFASLKDKEKILNGILKDEKEFIEKKEFLEFEVQKIASIDPSIEEYAKLMEVKKSLSKKEKLQEQIQSIEGLFDYEKNIIDFLHSMDTDSTFVNDFISELTEIMYASNDKIKELDEYDIETVLNRIDELANLKQRYGSIEEALVYKKEKEKILSEYENISFEKKNLEQEISALQTLTQTLSKDIGAERKKRLPAFVKEIGEYTAKLYLGSLDIKQQEKTLDASGGDELLVVLDGIECQKLSSGEVNRLRLALIAMKNKYKNSSGVLILDEIDANLSGAESESVSKILKEIAQNFQVFSISHQPHLSSYASGHFLVNKQKNSSQIEEIKEQERIQEIARMLSGKKITPTSLKLAHEFFSKNQ